MEWKKVKISDIATLINGRAYAQPELLYEGKYKIVRVGNLSGGDNWFFSNMELGEDKYCNEGDLLYAWACNFGPYIWHGDKTIFHYHIWKMILDESLANKSYLYYYLKYITPYWLGNVNGSVMVHITKGTMEKQEFPLPPLETQRRIAAILSSLDDKIENNNRINRNLEAQAQALFKSWFVDFEPWDGTMPEDWKEGNLLDIADLYDHKRIPLSGMQRDKMEKIYPYYGATSIMDYVDDYLFDGVYLLMGEDGSVMTDKGYPYLQYVEGKFWCNNHAHIMQGKNGYTTEMLYCLLNRTNVTGIVTGAVQGKISQASMKMIPVILPTANVCADMSDKLTPYFDEMRSLHRENSRLAALRDTLLPKLMKGEIEV